MRTFLASLSVFFWALAASAFAQEITEGQKRDLGNTSEIGGIPAVFRTPETGLGIGAVLIYTADTTVRKPSPIIGGLMYTEKKQLLFAAGSKQTFQDGRYAFYAFGDVAKFPQKFYGIGNRTLLANEEIYQEQRYSLDFGGEVNVLGPLNLGLGLHTRQDSFDSFEEDGFFAAKAVPGQNGGQQKGYMAYAYWDTADDNFYPTVGNKITFNYINYVESWGSRYPFEEFKLDVRDYRLVAPETILATQLAVRSCNSEPPFYQLEQLGGSDLLRGYFKGRFRDRKMAILQSEIRRSIAKSWRAVVFTGVGNVYRDWDEWLPSSLKLSYGAGLRYQITPTQKINVRFDVGLGDLRQGPQFYLYVMEAY